MAKTKYYESEIGPFAYPHLNKPDAKFNPENPVYKADLLLGGEKAQKLKARIDAAVDEAFEEFLSDPEQGGKLSPAERKKWTKYYPYEVLEDDNTGDPTGEIKFSFKQNAKIRLKDGTTKSIQIGLYDAKGKELPEGIFIRHLSEGRVGYSMRGIKMTTAKQYGVRLDFSKVQITKLAEGKGSGGFGAVDGGYEASDDDVDTSGFDATSGSGSTAGGEGDY